jgi:hypothetical protein
VARVPIACELTTQDADGRIEEWRQFLGGRVVQIVRSDRRARLRLVDGDEAMLVATDLARREKTCCPFFEFRLVPLPEATWLEVEVPAESTAILDGLVNLDQG